jgi:hypothetical protein
MTGLPIIGVAPSCILLAADFLTFSTFRVIIAHYHRFELITNRYPLGIANMKKTLLLALLLIPSLSMAASYSIAIKNDNQITKYFTGRPGAWLFSIATREADTTVTCDGAPCPDQINENQTITFTVNTPSKNQDLGFDLVFTSAGFVLADTVCFHKETYYIASGEKPTANNKISISDKPPIGTVEGSTECSPYLQKKAN